MIFSSRFTPWLVALLFLSGGILFAPSISTAQTQEPDVLPLPEPRTPYGEGDRTGLGVEIMVNNFGFGIAGEYTRVVGPFTEITFQTGITGLRDVSEQTYVDPLFGREIIPNKYKRAMAFPFMVGVQRRLFPRHIDDNFRLFVGASAGPVMAFLYPYFEDNDGNQYRTYIASGGFLIPTEQVNDFFMGWKDGETAWGTAGEIKIGVDVGESFSKTTTVEFGYYFYYFAQGIQMMEPFQPEEYDNSGAPVGQVPFFDAKKYFGTPQIKLIFGGIW